MDVDSQSEGEVVRECDDHDRLHFRIVSDLQNESISHSLVACPWPLPTADWAADAEC